MKQDSNGTSITARIGGCLDEVADLLFMTAFVLFCFKFFWGFAVRNFTLGVFDWIETWPTAVRVIVGVPLIGLPVGVAAFWLFGDEQSSEKGAIAKLFELRKSPRVQPVLALVRKTVGVLGMFALLKLMWLTGNQGAASIDWWSLLAELVRAF